MDADKFVNLTPHAIVVRTADGDVSIPPSGKAARVTMTEADGGFVGGVPAIIRRAGEVVLGYEPREEEVIIVSSMVLDAASEEMLNKWMIVAPDTGSSAVRNETGHIVAVTRLVRR